MRHDLRHLAEHIILVLRIMNNFSVLTTNMNVNMLMATLLMYKLKKYKEYYLSNKTKYTEFIFFINVGFIFMS